MGSGHFSKKVKMKNLMEYHFFSFWYLYSMTSWNYHFRYFLVAILWRFVFRLMAPTVCFFECHEKNWPHLSFRCRICWSRPGGVCKPVFRIQFTNTLAIRFLPGVCTLILNLLLHTQASSQLKYKIDKFYQCICIVGQFVHHNLGIVPFVT